MKQCQEFQQYLSANRNAWPSRKAFAP